VLELVRLDPENRKRPIRIWDTFSGDLVERDITHPEALRCDTLRLYWCVQEDPRLGLTLRLSRTNDGSSILPTPEEAERAGREAERAEKDAALARIAKLEAKLARKRGFP